MERLVSVIIPAFNAEKFIVEALESVYRQTYRPIEVIVVDDGSQDLTAAVVGRFQQQVAADGKAEGFVIRCIVQENGGPSRARNTGVKAASGEWIAFLDADDVWLPGKLGKQVSYLKSHPDVELVFGDMRIFDDKGVIVASAYGRYGYPACDEEGRFTQGFERLIESNQIFTGTVLVRKECLESVGLFDESIRHGEDYDMWLRLALTYSFGCIPDVMMNRRKHGDNLSAGEEHFYTSKLYILRKLQGNPAVDGSRHLLLQGSYLATKKELSYLFYLRKQYWRAISALFDYLLSYASISLFGFSLNKSRQSKHVFLG